ncbi:MAG: hypothetical protein P8L37_01790 [Phycisphaerales bacterium]|nr:hypothetical protein [Phycisphaerales bacterium]
MRTRNTHLTGRGGISRLDMSATPCSASRVDTHIDGDASTEASCSSSVTRTLEVDSNRVADDVALEVHQHTIPGFDAPMPAEQGAPEGEGQFASGCNTRLRASRWDPLLDTLAWSMLIWGPVCTWLAVQVQV